MWGSGDGMGDAGQGYDSTGQCNDDISWDEAGICVTSSYQSLRTVQENVSMDIDDASGDWMATLSVALGVTSS